MKLDGKLTILVNDDRTLIEVEDSLSSEEFLRIELTNKQLVQCLSRLACVRVELEVRNVDRVGKKMKLDKLEFEMPDHRISDRKEIAVMTAMDKCPNGWSPDLYFGSQNSFRNEGGKVIASTTIRTWE